MKHEPRPAIHIEEQLGWACKLGGAESLGTSKAGSTVLARMMESQIWYQLASPVREGFKKGTVSSSFLDTRPFSFSLCTTGAFQAATPVLELRGSESEWVSSCLGCLRGTACCFSSFFHPLNPFRFLPEVVGTYLPGTGTLD